MYGMNQHLSKQQVSRVRNLSAKVMLADHNWQSALVARWGPADITNNYFYMDIPHNGGTNVTFADGHNEWTKLRDIDKPESWERDK